MYGPRIAAEDERGTRKEMCELLEVRPPDEIHGRDPRRRHDVGGNRRIEMPPANEHGNDMRLIEAVAERGEVLRRPALVRPVRPDGKGDKRPPLRHALALQQHLRRHAVTIRDGDGKTHCIHTAADGACYIKIALDDVSVCVRPAHRAAHTVRALAHIRRADALPRSRRIDDRCRLEEPLQIERDIIAARAQTAAQGRIFTEESADAAELRLFKEDELIDVRISLKQRIGGRLDHPRQMCIGIGLLDGIGNGQRMNHIADRTEFDDQDILHGLPSFLSPYFRAYAACSLQPIQCDSPRECLVTQTGACSSA